jgi:hypothetical protein
MSFPTFSIPSNQSSALAQPFATMASSLTQPTPLQTYTNLSPHSIETTLDSSNSNSSNIQSITFGVLGITLAIGSLVVGYCQLRRMRRQSCQQREDEELEIGNAARYGFASFFGTLSWIFRRYPPTHIRNVVSQAKASGPTHTPRPLIVKIEPQSELSMIISGSRLIGPLPHDILHEAGMERGFGRACWAFYPYGLEFLAIFRNTLVVPTHGVYGVAVCKKKVYYLVTLKQFAEARIGHVLICLICSIIANHQ